MTTDEKLALLETFVREEGDGNAMVYARMYGMLSAYVRHEDLDTMIDYYERKLAN
jgi:hypothetical protein